MQDATLARMLADAVDDPSPALLSALADRLLDCPPEDRVEALAGLLDRSLRLKQVEKGARVRYSERPATVRFAARRLVHPEDLARSAVNIRELSLSQCRERCALDLVRRLEPRRWYAVRVRELERQPEGFGPHSRDVELAVDLTVCPIDGGRVLPE